jgi:3',5'-cyclic AMP phosphodiesterase CpdA
MDPFSMRRRDFLRSGAGLAASGITISMLGAANAAERKRVLRVAHLTDVHVQPELRAPEGMATCLRHVQAVADKPDLILSGGDHVMDCIRQPRERTRVQWDLWKRISTAETSIPIHSCLGNHDIWGWNKAKSGTSGNEPDFGKKWASEVLGLDKPYYSFDQSGWHFIALDGVQPSEPEGAFYGGLDEEQRAWLAGDLARVPPTTPILIWSHIPIVSALAPLINSKAPPTQPIPIEAGHIHWDAVQILALLTKYPNVKACLSGHLHRIDHVELKGIHFYCNGAVSGAWWKGKNDGFDEGYALLNLYDDGTLDCNYTTYGWNAATA